VNALPLPGSYYVPLRLLSIPDFVRDVAAKIERAEQESLLSPLGSRAESVSTPPTPLPAGQATGPPYFPSFRRSISDQDSRRTVPSRFSTPESRSHSKSNSDEKSLRM
jgi:hypothetical protein